MMKSDNIDEVLEKIAMDELIYGYGVVSVSEDGIRRLPPTSEEYIEAIEKCKNNKLNRQNEE